MVAAPVNALAPPRTWRERQVAVDQSRVEQDARDERGVELNDDLTIRVGAPGTVSTLYNLRGELARERRLSSEEQFELAVKRIRRALVVECICSRLRQDKLIVERLPARDVIEFGGAFAREQAAILRRYELKAVFGHPLEVGADYFQLQRPGGSPRARPRERRASTRRTSRGSPGRSAGETEPPDDVASGRRLAASTPWQAARLQLAEPFESALTALGQDERTTFLSMLACRVAAETARRLDDKTRPT